MLKRERKLEPLISTQVQMRMQGNIGNRIFFFSTVRPTRGVAPENVGLQKERKYNTFACHTCNEVRLCVLGIRKKEVGNTKR
jgi:hypothetical protein